MSDNSSDFGAFLAGFVIGGLVGAATALILAPQSGTETRSQITNRSEALRQAGGERFHHYREVAATYSQEYRDRAGATLAETREQVQERARLVLDAGRTQVARFSGQAEMAVQPEMPAQPTAVDGAVNGVGVGESEPKTGTGETNEPTV